MQHAKLFSSPVYHQPGALQLCHYVTELQGTCVRNVSTLMSICSVNHLCCTNVVGVLAFPIPGRFDVREEDWRHMMAVLDGDEQRTAGGTEGQVEALEVEFGTKDQWGI